MNEIILEAQALATVAEDQFETSLAKLIADLQAFQPTSEPVVIDPIVTVTTVTQSGVSTVFVPKV